MEKNYLKESIHWILMAIPFIYLAMHWTGLPEEVPTHWNAAGEADAWGTKKSIIFPLLMVTLLPYGIMLLAPSIDPKKKISTDTNKFFQIRLVMTICMSVIAFLIVFSTIHTGIKISAKLVLAAVCLLFIGLGNYLPTIKHNYMIGIRTPWTLENEDVWKSTHRLSGKVWVIVGLIMLASIILFPDRFAIIIFFAGTAVLVLIPTIHSYRRFKALDRD